MSVIEIIVIGLALAMDAFGVTLSVGVNASVKRKEKILYLLSFSGFQFLLIFIGGFIGYFFNNYVIPISNTLGGIVIGIIGILMIIEGFKSNDSSILNKKSMILILGISVSIDALVIGFTIFNDVSSVIVLFINSILIGFITLFMCTLGFFICRYIRKINFVKRYSSFFGGIALIILSIKTIFF